MLITDHETGPATEELRIRALEVLSTLSEDQIRVVVAYARALLGEGLPEPADDRLEDLVGESV